MATIAGLPGMYTYIRKLVFEERKSHRDISTELKRSYPMIKRGLSEKSVARFCESYNIHATSRISDLALDAAVRSSVAKVKVYVVILVWHVPDQNPSLGRPASVWGRGRSVW